MNECAQLDNKAKQREKTLKTDTKSSAVIGNPCLLEATTISPKRLRKSVYPKCVPNER